MSDTSFYHNLSPERKKELIKRSAETKRELRKDPKFREKENAQTRERRNTEEYRAKRRAAYARKHLNDPMTPHRKLVIEVMNKLTQIPLEERRKMSKHQRRRLMRRL